MVYVVSSPALPPGFRGRVNFFGALLPANIKYEINIRGLGQFKSFVSHPESARYLDVKVNSRSIDGSDLKIGDRLIGIRPTGRRKSKERKVTGREDEFEGFTVEILEVF